MTIRHAIRREVVACHAVSFRGTVGFNAFARIAPFWRVSKREGDAFSRVALNIGGTTFIDWIARNNGKVLSDDATKVAFNSPQGQATLEWILDTTNRLYGSASRRR